MEVCSLAMIGSVNCGDWGKAPSRRALEGIRPGRELFGERGLVVLPEMYVKPFEGSRVMERVTSWDEGVGYVWDER